MNEIILSDDLKNTSAVVYSYNAVNKRLPSRLKPPSLEIGDRARILVDKDSYKEYLPFFLPVVTDAIAVGRKYSFFSERLALPRLKKRERTEFLLAVVSADFSVDSRYIKERVASCSTYTLDGVFSFLLSPLKRKWERILSAVPPDINKREAENFLEFIIRDNKGRAYVSENVVYDYKFLPVERSKLLPIERFDRIKADVILSGAGEVYVAGELDKTTLDFLKRFYPTKSFFGEKTKKGLT